MTDTISNEIIASNALTSSPLLETMKSALPDDCLGLDFSFDKVKVPSGGGTTFEIPSYEGTESEAVKDISGVIIHNHPSYVYFKEKYTGGNSRPDCSSFDGKIGIGIPGGDCNICPNNQFGSGEGRSKLCKNKRTLYILREHDVFPITLTLPVGSLRAFTNYAKSLLYKGKHLNQAVTKITLKKAVNASGIPFSQTVFNFERLLSSEESNSLTELIENVKIYAANLAKKSAVENRGNSAIECEHIEPLN